MHSKLFKAFPYLADDYAVASFGICWKHSQGQFKLCPNRIIWNINRRVKSFLHLALISAREALGFSMFYVVIARIMQGDTWARVSLRFYSAIFLLLQENLGLGDHYALFYHKNAIKWDEISGSCERLSTDR